MRVRAAIFSLITLASVLLASRGLRAQELPERVPAPEFGATTWVNTKPLSLKDLRGKVVLVDFWEYTCINCIRTFPYLRRWHELYGPLGLVIIGVHTPEFEFAKNPELVEHAAHRFKLDFPIAVDSDRTIWDAYHNDAWPADYLIDAKGDITFIHLGEGEYADMEHRIQALLREANPKLDFAAAMYRVPADQPEMGGACLRSTPETYLGFARAERMANEGGYRMMSAASYRQPRELPLDEYALDGRWLATPEYIKHAADDGESSPASLSLHYRAKTVYLVAGSDNAPGAPLYVEQDGKPVAPSGRGVDIKQDASGRTYIALQKKRMYYVANNPGFGDHTIKLTADSPAVALYSFTFGNNCETQFDRK